jgi:VWFA-related protein
MRTQFLLAVLLGVHGTVSLAQQPASLPSPTPIPTPVPARQSQQPDADEVVRITTNLVQVDAVVTDRNGNPVTDLKPEEVRIFEDERQQKITHFSFINAAGSETANASKPTSLDKSSPAPPPIALKPEQVRRTIAIVVDDLGLSFQSTSSVRNALRKFVDEQMQPGDLVAIIRTSGGIGALQQFTSDKRQLYAAINHVKWYVSGRAVSGTFAPAGSALDTGTPADQQPAFDNQQQFSEEFFTVGTLGAIDYVVRGLHELPGRKSIILISDGIKLLNHIDPAQQANFRNANPANIVRDRVVDALRRLTDLANRASVVIYTLDPRGLEPSQLQAADDTSPGSGESVVSPVEMHQRISDRHADFAEGQNGMNYLAQETGGFFIHNTNDLGRGIRRVLEDQKGYYLIGYRPDESTFDQRTGRRQFHHLSMRVTRPGKFIVRMRNGFFGVADAAELRSPRTARDQIVNALTSPFGSSDVHLQLTSLFGNDAKVGSFMRSVLHVDANDLTFTDEPDGWHQATFDVVAVTFGDNGNVVDEISRTDTFKVRGEGYQEVRKHGFVYFVVLPIKKSGAYQLRTVLRDHDSQRTGSASQFVEIPDLKKGRLALSGIMVKAVNQPGTDQKNGRERELDPQAGEAVRHFQTGMLMRYGFVIYNARLDKATRQPQLQIQARLFRNGQPVFTGKVQPFVLNNPPDLGRLSVDGAITLGADLVPGEYVLQVIVNDSLAEPQHRTTTQWVDFEIVR